MQAVLPNGLPVGSRRYTVQLLIISRKLLGRNSNQGFIHILGCLDHMLYMRCREAHAVRVGEISATLGSERKQSRVGQGDHLFLSGPIARGNEKLNVDSIRVPDGNSCLQPSELYSPCAPKGIRSGVKKATFVTHDPMLTRGKALRRTARLDGGRPLAD